MKSARLSILLLVGHASLEADYSRSLGKTKENSRGLLGVGEPVVMVNREFIIQSAPGGPTTIHAEVPSKSNASIVNPMLHGGSQAPQILQTSKL